jgi:hypothetical protein
MFRGLRYDDSRREVSINLKAFRTIAALDCPEVWPTGLRWRTVTMWE